MILVAPPTLVPSKDVLQRWRDEGLTQKQMVERTLTEYGNVVTRSAIAAAMSRYGLSGDSHRYADTVPWRINADHATAHPLRMLRLLGRRREGGSLSEKETAMLDSWLGTLAEREWIVGYDADDHRGFHYIDAAYRDHDDDELPIRVKRLRMANPRHAG